MDKLFILKLLEQQRDSLFDSLKATSVSGLYKSKYGDIRSGNGFVFDNGEQGLLSDLEKLSDYTSHDELFTSKLTEYLNLDNNALIAYFQNQFLGIFEQIRISGKQDDIQAVFIEYDYYYHFTSSISCYGRQEYPLIEVPRYISNEYDYTKRELFLDTGVNFQPAWLDCREFEDLDYLDINYQLEELFQLHSRVLLHRALDLLENEGRMGLFQNRPFSFYINEHDSEVMILYRLN